MLQPQPQSQQCELTAQQQKSSWAQQLAVNSTACLQKTHIKNTWMLVIATFGLEGTVCTLEPTSQC